ncbi:MAG: peptidoglycan-binding protein [Clostridia bacterium]|nr:peptidoglycan-binding protein [Clostridia bacterium]
MNLQKGKGTFAAALVSVLVFCFSFNSVSAAGLKEGMKGSSVTTLQKDLKKLGFLDAEPTGYYGDATEKAVKKLQARYGLKQDGMAGNSTLAQINKLLGKKQSTTSTADSNYKGYLTSWFGGANKVFANGSVATVYDIATGLSFKAKRTYGYNHADCEPLTSKDTAVMKKIYGGSWDWGRRAVIVTVNGKKLAASMAGMPHAGVESKPKNILVSSRSAGYGRGANLDAVKNNAMSGHFDIHFLGSKTHGSNRVDRNHQATVKKAAEWAKKNN